MKYKIEGLAAGELRERLERIDSELDATELKISGSLNEDDMLCIRLLTSRKGNMKVLDISDTAGIEEIDRYSIEPGSPLNTLRLPKSLKTIGWGALSMCEKLSTVVMYTGLEKIENYAFNGCTALKTISIPSTVNFIGTDAFGACPKLEEFNVPLTNRSYTALDGVLFSRDGKTLLKYPAGKTGIKYAMPQDVTRIGKSAFFLCENIRSVVLSESLTDIEEKALYGCSNLQTLHLPQNVKNIGKSAFGNCTSMIEMFIDGANPPAIEVAEEDKLGVNIYVSLKSADIYRQSEWSKIGKIYGK